MKPSQQIVHILPAVPAYAKFAVAGGESRMCAHTCAVSLPGLQEEDVIGTLGADEKIASLKPLGDRVLIKVRPRGGARVRAD
jgi:hypothetical protein